jgi:transcriptional regulator with XRE-family HTH domain
MTSIPLWAKIARQRMAALSITQDDLRLIFNVHTRGAVGHYLSGRREPGILQLQTLAKHLQLSVSQLIGEHPLDSNCTPANREIVALYDMASLEARSMVIAALKESINFTDSDPHQSGPPH